MIRPIADCPKRNRLLAQAVECVNRNELQQDHSAEPAVDKAFAMFLFDTGACDLQRTQAAFDRHPDWREA